MIHRLADRSRRFAYHANVMNTFEADNMKMVTKVA